MNMLFYHIYKNENGGFTYHEFISGFGNGYGFCGNDAYCYFETYDMAKNHAIKRGGSDVYSY